jgi:hypothetical protein
VVVGAQVHGYTRFGKLISSCTFCQSKIQEMCDEVWFLFPGAASWVKCSQGVTKESNPKKLCKSSWSENVGVHAASARCNSDRGGIQKDGLWAGGMASDFQKVMWKQVRIESMFCNCHWSTSLQLFRGDLQNQICRFKIKSVDSKAKIKSPCKTLLT